MAHSRCLVQQSIIAVLPLGSRSLNVLETRPHLVPLTLLSM